MSDLKITIIQSNLHWENIDKNLSMFAEKIKTIEEHTDLIILPEMFTTGFTMNAANLAESMNGKTMEWMKAIAEKANAVVTGSVIIKENNLFYNRLLWIKPDGNYFSYDKKHLFSLGKEEETYTSGDKKLTVKIGEWKIQPMICYDLRFPKWCRNDNDYDVLLFVANWPEKRITHWDTLLKARAIENQSYVIGVNRYGMDGNEIYHPGNSAVIDAYGDTLFFSRDEESIQTITLSRDHLKLIRRQYPFLKDRD
jgi:omega-amidase